MDQGAGKRNYNRLKEEKSPYLLQHAENPVNWYPWSEDAFEKAREEDRPIFLSIGYSTCHWCHVMAHESFEDEDVASLMNDAFVSIKVDREERPDIDGIYMAVCQLMTGSGGWPLTIIMTPDKKPFFSATYIPKKSRFGRTGMLDLIPQVKAVWDMERGKVMESVESVEKALRDLHVEGGSVDLNEKVLDKAFEQLSVSYDDIHGGFGIHPKFPTAHNLMFLLRYWRRSGNEKALVMVEKTLKEMRWGGMYDHLGFGFHRYSTDQKWLLPHFEKMLYDQALLAVAYIEAYQATRKEEYAETAREIFSYLQRDMTSPEGAFYSAEDADSEGVEGKFYVWTEGEIRRVLKQEDADLAMEVYNAKPQGNFEDEATGRKTGANILHMTGPMDEDKRLRVESIRKILLDIRRGRVHPHKDDKVLTDWNGLMIAALAKGAQVLGEEEYAGTAKRAADFILERMRTPQGRLLHRYRDDEAAIIANGDDYAFFIWGLLELYETTFEVQYLRAARDLNLQMVEHFWDHEMGGFYFTPDDGEELMIRKKEAYDGATPSCNSVAMFNMLRLGRMTSDAGLEEKAAGIARTFGGQVKKGPMAYTMLLSALDFALGPSYEVVIAGENGGEDTKEMVGSLRQGFHPNKVTLFIPTDEEDPEVSEFIEDVEVYETIKGKATAYVCTNFNCKLPTSDVDKMLELLDGRG